MPESQVRVISPRRRRRIRRKISPYPEDYLVTAASKICRTPGASWIEDRTESLQATTHGRGQIFDVEVAAKRDGTLLGAEVHAVARHAARTRHVQRLPGGRVPAGRWLLRVEGDRARTVGMLHQPHVDRPVPRRGTARGDASRRAHGRPGRRSRSAWTRPRSVARTSSRRVPATRTTSASSTTPATTRGRSTTRDGEHRLRRRSASDRRSCAPAGSLHSASDFSTWIEICGIGPSAATAPAAGGSRWSSRLDGASASHRIGDRSRRHHAHGQGHETTFAQIVADTLGVPYESIEIRHGDTGEGPPFGYGTYGVAQPRGRRHGDAQRPATRSSRRRASSPRTLSRRPRTTSSSTRARFFVKGNPARRRRWARAGVRARTAPDLPEGMEHGLEAVSYFDPPNFVWPFGAHICAVEVDPETGSVDHRRSTSRSTTAATSSTR